MERSHTQNLIDRVFYAGFLVLCGAIPAKADALLPTVVLISPITVLLLLPIIAIEAWYVSRSLRVRFWKSTGVMTLANVVSTIAGIQLPSPSERIQPLLARISSSSVASRIGVSRWYAGRVRRGYRPHPRHWQALAVLVGVSVDT